jgi:hypothetical protein
MERNCQIGFASCWHINDNLNFNMWDSYGHKAPYTIALRISEKKLSSSLRKSGFPFLNEPVEYFDEPYFYQHAYASQRCLKGRNIKVRKNLEAYYLPMVIIRWH